MIHLLQNIKRFSLLAARNGGETYGTYTWQEEIISLSTYVALVRMPVVGTAVVGK